MRVHQSEILYIVTRNLYQNIAAMWKNAWIANFGKNLQRNTKNLVKRLKKRVFLGKFGSERINE